MRRSIKRLAKQAFEWAHSVQRGGQTQKKVILLGHMRCGSSLMVHILASNPDIASVGETHLTYASSKDLDRLPPTVYLALRRFRPARLVLDKVLHDEYIAADAILEDQDCTFPIMARESLASVASTVTSLPGWFGRPQPSPPEMMSRAADYYRRRLDTLARYGEKLARCGRCFYFNYEDLLHRTSDVFHMMEQCLILRSPLSEQYRVGSRTGVHGYGDPSDNIRRGCIDRSIHRSSVELPDKLADQLQHHYQSFDAHMRRLSQSLSTASSPLRSI